MKILVYLSQDDYKILDDYCNRVGGKKSTVISMLIKTHLPSQESLQSTTVPSGSKMINTSSDAHRYTPKPYWDRTLGQWVEPVLDPPELPKTKPAIPEESRKIVDDYAA